MAQFPCLFTPLANSLLLQSRSYFTYLETLLGVIQSRPPWPQVTRKLTSPFPSPPYSLPIPNSQHPRLIVRLTKTTSWSRLLMVRNSPLQSDIGGSDIRLRSYIMDSDIRLSQISEVPITDSVWYRSSRKSISVPTFAKKVAKFGLWQLIVYISN